MPLLATRFEAARLLRERRNAPLRLERGVEAHAALLARGAPLRPHHRRLQQRLRPQFFAKNYNAIFRKISDELSR